MTGKITIKQAAILASVTTQTIRNWIESGELDTQKSRSAVVRGKRSILSVDLQQLMELLKKKGLA